MNENLLKLPFEIQAILAIGYVAYRLATTGLNKHHRTGDFVLQVMVYGAIAKLVQEVAHAKYASQWPTLERWPTFGIALVVTLVAAAIWRAFGNQLAIGILRYLKVTRENYSPSTWTSLLNCRHPWKYVSILVADGTWLDSNIDALPDKLPLDPLDVDAEGNIAIYVTRLTHPNGQVSIFGEEGIRDSHGRTHLTYIPAAQIRRVNVSLGVMPSESTTS